jgi:hypothetical protein
VESVWELQITFVITLVYIGFTLLSVVTPVSAEYARMFRRCKCFCVFVIRGLVVSYFEGGGNFDICGQLLGYVLVFLDITVMMLVFLMMFIDFYFGVIYYFRCGCVFR